MFQNSPFSNINNYFITIKVLGIITGIIGGGIGIVKGFEEWKVWAQYFKGRKLSNLYFLELIINYSIVLGKLLYLTGSYGISYFIVASTFPISVPILLYLFEKKQN